jgi:dolichol-phosphate mannosyltransferase
MALDRPPSLCVVVPAYNEEANLPGCLGALHQTLEGSPYQIVIVDDGSTDRSLEVARALAAERPERIGVMAHAKNQGLGAALKTGFAAATTDYVTCCPADFPMSVEDWAPFAAALGRADVIVGRRQRREGYNPLMRLNSWIYPKLVDAMFGLGLRDVNWISVYRRDLVEQVAITQRGIPMLVEILIRLRDLGATFCEVDCQMRSRVVGTPSAAKPRVMWRTLIGLLALWRSYRRSAPSRAMSPPHGANS